MRIKILKEELQDKSEQITEISSAKEKLEKVSERALQLGMDINDQQEAVDSLNEKYKKALKAKVETYDELVASVKELVRRHT